MQVAELRRDRFPVFALSQGRCLILLDGLDEVPESDSDAVVRQIRHFAGKYYSNQFIITCRIAASKYRSDPQALEKLVSHITHKRWREVLLLAVGILQNAEELLLLMKQQVDGPVAEDEQLQQYFLSQYRSRLAI